MKKQNAKAAPKRGVVSAIGCSVPKRTERGALIDIYNQATRRQRGSRLCRYLEEDLLIIESMAIRALGGRPNPGVHPSPDASTGVGGATRCCGS